MKASAKHTKANTSLHNIVFPKVPQLRRVPTLGPDPDVSLKRLTVTRTMKRFYLLGSLAILFLTTLLWATLGARLQNNNADQLSDSYLFESARTFHQATFPGQHTFLLKWPLFWLQSIIGINISSFELTTVFVTLLTVAGLAYLLRRIERRPVMVGTIYLGLASALLLVPAVPYPGALLPTNLAMLTTRNLEYLVYMFALVLVARAKLWRCWQLVFASIALGALFASDKLFLSLALGGSVVMLAVYALTKRQALRTMAVCWLVATVAGAVMATITLIGVQHHSITGISSQAGVGPYAVTTSPHNLALGAIYGVLAVFTNFGANPAHGVLTLHEVPGAFRAELVSASLPAYLVNLMLLAFCAYVVFWVLRSSFAYRKLSPRSKKPLEEVSGVGLGLAIMLVSSSVVSLVSFAVTKHYYVVDSRYLTITMFALFVCLAVYSRSRLWRSLSVMTMGGVLLVGCLAGSYFAVHNYQLNRDALGRDQARNMLVAQVLRSHKTALLLGDYWRVLPIKVQVDHPQTVLPLSDCTTPRTDLSSRAWRLDMQHSSFAYLLSLDGGTASFPACSLAQVTKQYGQPNAITVIAGSTDQPKEVVLFYDHGANNFKPISQPMAVARGGQASVVTPIAVDKLLDVDCPTGQTLMQIVAHEDDDLLFMSPDLEHAVGAGQCVRTVYVTAGDAGSSKFYWLGREQGSEAAYAKLAGVPNVWLQQTVKIAPHEFVTIASPARNSRLTLVFMHLPDGNVNGQGFASSTDEGLAKLGSGTIASISSVDGQSRYSYDQLRDAIRALINVYSPDTLHTQLPQNASETYPDHSDHLAVGRLTTAAFQPFALNHPLTRLTYYTGYPVHDQPQNVSGTDLDRKEQVFFTYSHFDGSTCQSAEQCASSSVYEVYLQRQYSTPAQL